MQGVLIELPLAGFFLKKMRNPHSDINDLLTLDPELYRNLMFLRDYEGDFADLALTFTTADDNLETNREVSPVLQLHSLDKPCFALLLSLAPFSMVTKPAGLLL